MKDRKDYYVYGHYKSGVLRYIGSGRGGRAFRFGDNDRRKSWLKEFPNRDPEVKILHINLTKDESLTKEAELINSTENLINIITSRGDNFRFFSKDDHQRLALLRSGQNHWTFGKERDEETKRKISETKKLNPTRYWLGKKRDPELMKKMSLAAQSEESKRKRYEGRIGVKLSEEHKQKIKYSLPKKKVMCSNGMVFESINDAARWANIGCGRISECVNGKRKTAKGLTFNLVEN